MAKKYGLGLVKLEMGDVANDGGMGTTLTEVGNTVKGSATLSSEEGTTTDFFVEEEDDPVESIQTEKGKTTFVFSCYDMSADTLERFFGGTVVAGPPQVWQAPKNIAPKEQSLKITDAKGNVIRIARGSVVPKFNWSLTRDKLAQTDLTVTVLSPSKTNEPPMSITYAV